MKILIKSAKIIAPESPFHGKKRDILVVDGRIVKIAEKIRNDTDRQIDVANLHVSLGWFDSSVSFGEPGYEERETLANGALAAAKAGFTDIALNPDTLPITDHHAAVDFLKNKASHTATKVHPIGALTRESRGKELAELYDMLTAGAVAFGDYKKSISNPNLLKIALQYAQGFEGLVQAFPLEANLSKNAVAHEGKISTRLGLKGMPALAEELQIARDLAILEYTGGKLHIPTISTAKSVDLIAEAKRKGLDVSCSVAIYNLWFTDEMLNDFDAAFKVFPPLREESDRQALIKGVKSGVIDMVTGDHRPMNVERKKLEFEHAAFGSLGLESAFGALHKLFGLKKTIALLTAGRKRFGLDLPDFEEGKQANLTFFNPIKKIEFQVSDIHSTAKNGMFVGAELKGNVIGVLAHNHLILS